MFYLFITSVLRSNFQRKHQNRKLLEFNAFFLASLEKAKFKETFVALCIRVRPEQSF